MHLGTYLFLLWRIPIWVSFILPLTIIVAFCDWNLCSGWLGCLLCSCLCLFCRGPREEAKSVSKLMWKAWELVSMFQILVQIQLLSQLSSSCWLFSPLMFETAIQSEHLFANFLRSHLYCRRESFFWRVIWSGQIDIYGIGRDALCVTGIFAGFLEVLTRAYFQDCHWLYIHLGTQAL